jgi:uncharacterized membrane protein (GlpM family)
MGVDARRSRSLATLIVAPALLVLAVAVWFVSDRLVVIGPFDRAKIAWAVVLPLLAIAPGAAALAGSGSTSPRLARLVVAGTSIATGIFVVLGLVSAITFIDCRQATGPLEVVPRTLPTAFVLGIGFAISAAAAWGPALHGRRVVALVVGATVWIVAAALGLFAFFVSFPPLSCGAPQV